MGAHAPSENVDFEQLLPLPPFPEVEQLGDKMAFLENLSIKSKPPWG